MAFLVGVFSRRIVGWRQSSSMHTEFVLDALEQALYDRKPSEDDGLVHHSDRGSQYLSIRHSERLAEAGIEPSVDAKSDSYDNALAETINGLYKAEVIHRRGPWKTRQAVELATLEWVAWFNHHRLMEPLVYIPLAEFEANYHRQRAGQAATGRLKPTGLRETRGDSTAPLRVVPPRLSLSLEHLAHRVDLEHRVGQQLLELRVLGVQHPLPLRVRDVHAAEFRLPGMVARLAEAMLPAQFLDRRPASASRRNLMICSSVYRFFIGPISISGCSDTRTFCCESQRAAQDGNGFDRPAAPAGGASPSVERLRYCVSGSFRISELACCRCPTAARDTERQQFW